MMADASGTFGRGESGSEVLRRTWSIQCLVLVTRFPKGELDQKS